MYRHTTPTPLKYILQNDFDSASKVPLVDSEVEAECVWGDYPGSRTGTGRYCDLSIEGIPVGRLWATDKTVGLLHVPVEGALERQVSELQHWNAAMEIRKSFHYKVPAGEAFDALLATFNHTPVVESENIENINFPEVDAYFYQGRYDPSDDYVWCEEMK